MTTADLSALDAFDSAEFVTTRDRRNSYTGEIPAKVQAFVDRAIETGKIGFLPLTEDQQTEMAPVISAAAAVRDKSARVWAKFAKKEDGSKGARLGTNVSVGAKRPGKTATNGDADAAPAESE